MQDAESTGLSNRPRPPPTTVEENWLLGHMRLDPPANHLACGPFAQVLASQHTRGPETQRLCLRPLLAAAEQLDKNQDSSVHPPVRIRISALRIPWQQSRHSSPSCS